MHQIKINNDGSISIDDNKVFIGNLKIIKELPLGANSVVFYARNEFLSREEVVKIWLKVKPNDARDKFKQGIEEARKTASINDSHVVRIYDAGEKYGYFYATMEYFHGITLEEWLKHYSPVLGSRWELAYKLIKTVCSITTPLTFHGDLHSRNIIVDVTPDLPIEYCRHTLPDYRIIDFGTSRFTSHEYSIDRHWDILTDTIDEILYPLSIGNLWLPDKPNPENIGGNFQWYISYAGMITQMMAWLGADWIEPVFTFPDHEVLEFVNKQKLRELVEDGSLVVDGEYLGSFADWHHDLLNVGEEGEALF